MGAIKRRDAQRRAGSTDGTPNQAMQTALSSAHAMTPCLKAETTQRTLTNSNTAAPTVMAAAQECQVLLTAASRLVIVAAADYGRGASRRHGISFGARFLWWYSS